MELLPEEAAAQTVKAVVVARFSSLPGILTEAGPKAFYIASPAVNGDGASPNTDLVFDSQGNLYGTTAGGGQNRCYSGCGIVFRLTPNSNGTWTESIIYAFAGAPDGANPASAVILDNNGNIYGTTAYGGTEPCEKGGHFSGCGSLYELTPNSGGGWTETLPYNFHRFQGTARTPSGGLLLTADGQLLGSSSIGGDRVGALFQLQETKKGWEQTVLYRFYGSPDGESPVGRLVIGPNGEVYGATANGGSNAIQYNGTVFELEHVNGRWKERVLFNANSAAYSPQAGPTVDSQGHLYGTFAGGGQGGNFGAVYEIYPVNLITISAEAIMTAQNSRHSKSRRGDRPACVAVGLEKRLAAYASVAAAAGVSVAAMAASAEGKIIYTPTNTPINGALQLT